MPSFWMRTALMSLSRLNHTFFSHPRWAGISTTLGFNLSHFLASNDSSRAASCLRKRDLIIPVAPIKDANRVPLANRQQRPLILNKLQKSKEIKDLRCGLKYRKIEIETFVLKTNQVSQCCRHQPHCQKPL